MTPMRHPSVLPWELQAAAMTTRLKEHVVGEHEMKTIAVFAKFQLQYCSGYIAPIVSIKHLVSIK